MSVYDEKSSRYWYRVSDRAEVGVRDREVSPNL